MENSAAAGAFVEHVGIEIVGAQQRDLVLPRLALGGEAIALLRQRDLLLREVLLRFEPMRAGVSRQAKVADDQRRDRVEAERSQDGAQARAGDHAGRMGVQSK